jgi:heme/copper-type cytochrome/quinol oxidase subunit 2
MTNILCWFGGAGLVVVVVVVVIVICRGLGKIALQLMHMGSRPDERGQDEFITGFLLCLGLFIAVIVVTVGKLAFCALLAGHW